jgi:haloacetate dehalogenase
MSFSSSFLLKTFSNANLRLRYRIGGQGPFLLLLHGYPQTHFMWHKVAPLLQEHFTLVMPDLRGYGQSSKGLSMTKREMAQDFIALMDSLGAKEFYLCGHDRGGRVAHRLGYDHPTRVKKLITLDIAPTREMYQETGVDFAKAYWHWFFLILPKPFPENMILADPKAYWLKKCGSGSAGLSPFSDEALADYLNCFNEETIYASCEDYRMSATLDIEHDNAETQKLSTPLLALWGANGAVNACFDVLSLWRERAENVSGFTLNCGHYMAEECPQEVASAIKEFFILT